MNRISIFKAALALGAAAFGISQMGLPAYGGTYLEKQLNTGHGNVGILPGGCYFPLPKMPPGTGDKEKAKLPVSVANDAKKEELQTAAPPAGALHDGEGTSYGNDGLYAPEDGPPIDQPTDPNDGPPQDDTYYPGPDPDDSGEVGPGPGDFPDFNDQGQYLIGIDENGQPIYGDAAGPPTDDQGVGDGPPDVGPGDGEGPPPDDTYYPGPEVDTGADASSGDVVHDNQADFDALLAYAAEHFPGQQVDGVFWNDETGQWEFTFVDPSAPDGPPDTYDQYVDWNGENYLVTPATDPLFFDPSEPPDNVMTATYNPIEHRWEYTYYDGPDGPSDTYYGRVEWNRDIYVVTPETDPAFFEGPPPGNSSATYDPTTHQWVTGIDADGNRIYEFVPDGPAADHVYLDVTYCPAPDEPMIAEPVMADVAPAIQAAPVEVAPAPKHPVRIVWGPNGWVDVGAEDAKGKDKDKGKDPAQKPQVLAAVNGGNNANDDNQQEGGNGKKVVGKGHDSDGDFVIYEGGEAKRPDGKKAVRPGA